MNDTLSHLIPSILDDALCVHTCTMPIVYTGTRFRLATCGTVQVLPLSFQLSPFPRVLEISGMTGGCG